MSPSREPGPYPIAGASMPTWIVRFDERGQCTSPATETALIELLKTGAFSNVLFYSHGWNTDFSDAIDQYSRFLTAFSSVLLSHPIAGFSPIFVGVTWPSVWMAGDSGPAMAMVGDDAETGNELVAAVAAPLSAPERDRLYVLADSASLDRASAVEFARMLLPAVGDAPEEVDGDASQALTAEAIVDAAKALADAEGTTLVTGGAPVELDEMGLPIAQATGFLDAIDPRTVLRLFSLFQMKDRAGTVGANGVAALLRRILGASNASVNVFGHSFGCKVMLSAICAPDPLPRKVDTLLLLQPAISYLALASAIDPGPSRPGGYRPALDRVAGPIFSTFSKMDRPLHDVFHLAVRRAIDAGEIKIAAAGEPPNRYAALGGYGPRRSGEKLLDPIHSPGEPYGDLEGERLIGLDGSDGRITSHGDVANGYTAWALRQLVLYGRGEAG